MTLRQCAEDPWCALGYLVGTGGKMHVALGIESQGLCPQVPGQVHLHHQHPWRQPPLSIHGGRNLNCSHPPPIPPSKPGLAPPLGRPGAGGACGGTSTDAKIPEGWCRGFLLMASSPSCSASSLLEGNRRGQTLHVFPTPPLEPRDCLST